MSTTGTTSAAPVASAERHAIIDIIRGYALFGVLLANMVWTTQYFPRPESGHANESTSWEHAGEFLMQLLVDFKFYTLFSLLFGVGFALQLASAAARGTNPLPAYLRRSGVLLLLGVAHAVLLWFGDILHIYALLGLALIFFRKMSDRRVLAWAIGIAVFTMLMPMLSLALEQIGVPISTTGIPGMSPMERNAVMSSGTWSDIVRMNWNFQLADYSSVNLNVDSMLYWYSSVLWKFLLGFTIGRRMLLQNAAAHGDVFRRLLPWLFIVGIAGNAFFAIGTPDNPVAFATTWPIVEIGISALSAAYLCALVLLFQRSSTRRLVELLAPAGRMALTNYLTHSACIVFLFYGIGIGLLGDVGIWGCVGISVVIFAIQIALSRWWLSRFRFGPVEWAWRCLTYARLQPIRIV